SKSNLRRSVEEHGMLYAHFPELGVPRDIRAKAIDAGTRDVIWEWYDHNVVHPYLGRNLHQFLNGLEHPVAMMCVEIDPHECHRHRLFLALEEMGLNGFDLSQIMLPPVETKRALIVVRTYPVPAKQRLEVSRTAALTDTGERW